MEYKIGNEARCAVIGYGSWATAIVGLLTDVLLLMVTPMMRAMII